MSKENTIFTKAAYPAARARFLKRFAARQAAEEIIGPHRSCAFHGC